jgi:hypothetical protein
MRRTLFTVVLFAAAAFPVVGFAGQTTARPSPVATSAAGKVRSPVIRCYDFSTGRTVERYAPRGYCNFYDPGPLEPTIVNRCDGGDCGITHTHWRHWGNRFAGGRGYYFDSLGYRHPARMTAYRLIACGRRRSAYSRMRIKWKGEWAGGDWRPGGNRVFPVAPNSC